MFVLDIVTKITDLHGLFETRRRLKVMDHSQRGRCRTLFFSSSYRSKNTITTHSGPCGGNLEWGANGFVQINNGQEIDLRISYNGGHQSANNAFHVAFKCADTDPSELTQDIFNNGAYTVAKTGCQNIAATDSRVNPPYELSCTLDREQRADTEDVFCTIAVIDQRNWGGCIDVKITPDAAPTPGEGSSSTLDEFYLVNEIVDTSPPDSTFVLSPSLSLSLSLSLCLSPHINTHTHTHQVRAVNSQKLRSM